MPIYTDPVTGQAVSTHSMLKTFRRCPKMAEYKYLLRLKPKVLGKPLRRGTWIHKLLEVQMRGEDWEAEHRRLCLQFSDLFDEEKDALGDLPTEMHKLMRSYLWHYKADPWTVHDVEFILECDFPDGSIYRCKIDALIENQYGLWIVDHKSHKKLPDLAYRLLDAQSALYIWCALRNKIPVQGHIWNYLRTKAPTEPALLKSGKSISRNKKIETDYPTLLRTLKGHGLSLGPYKEQLLALKAQRYVPGEMQISPFFRRDVLEKSPALLRRVAQEGYHTSLRMHSYPWDKVDIVERVVDRSCTFMCNYTDLCTTELFGGNPDLLLRRKYTVGDPLEYYQDDREEAVHGA